MYTFGPIAVAVGLAGSAVTALTAALTPLFGNAAAAVAIVCLTVVVRLALSPLSFAQVRGERARARLAPRLQEVRRRHAGDRQRLLAEQQRLYRESGTSPLAGCLPTLAQMPVFMALYGVFIGASGPTTLLHHTLGGVSLDSTLGDVVAAGVGPQALVFAALLAVLAGVAWASRRWLTLPALDANASATSGGPALPTARLMSYLPFGTVAVAAFLPLAAGLYLATSTAWTLGERLALRQLITGG